MKIIKLLPFVLLILGCDGNLNVTPLAPALKSLPDFNFQIRTVSGMETIRQSEYQRFELYVKQQGAEILATDYIFEFSVTEFDGNIEFNKAIYRPNDQIRIPYTDLKKVQNLLYFNYYPIKPAVGVHTVTFSLKDAQKRVKSVQKKVVVVL
ncbi:hypothetical protein [Runella limosa]|uniref:hypothetical protein n=1 Tax=Runella limosa TaxID=370978 RepID=UPI000409684A|nr:hypothetical protein [Runella limosa]